MKSDHSHNGRERAGEVPEVSHLRKGDVSREMRDVNIRAILMFVVGLTFMTIAVYLLMWGMFRALNSQEQGKESQLPPSPMAMSGAERVPPEPRLQSAPGFAESLGKETGEEAMTASPSMPKDPLWEIQVLRRHWQYTLKNGVKDQSGKVIALPIEEAKRELLKQGVPSRASQPGPGWVTSDYGVDLPTAASSGRVTTRTRQ